MKDNFTPIVSKAETQTLDRFEQKGIITERQVMIPTQWEGYNYYLDGLTPDKTDIEFNGILYHQDQNRSRIRALFLKNNHGIFTINLEFDIPQDLIYGNKFGLLRDKVRYKYEEWKREFDEEKGEKVLGFLKEKEVYDFISSSIQRGYDGDETGLLDDKFKRECEKFKKNFEKNNFNKNI